MAKFTVHTPEADWSGEVGGVHFAAGVATVDDQTDASVLAYCRTAGYHVEPVAEPEPPAEAKRSRAVTKPNDKEGAGE